MPSRLRCQNSCGAVLTSVSSFANAAAVCTTGLRRLAYRMQQTPTVSWLQASAAAGACTSRARGLLQETLADVVSMLLHRGSVYLVGRGGGSSRLCSCQMHQFGRPATNGLTKHCNPDLSCCIKGKCPLCLLRPATCQALRADLSGQQQGCHPSGPTACR